MDADLAKLEDLKKMVARLVASKKKFLQLSETRRNMSTCTHTHKRIENAEATLNWHAMEHDKLVHDTHAAAVDCDLAEPRDDYCAIEYKPSPFHQYTHMPRVPLCKQESQGNNTK